MLPCWNVITASATRCGNSCPQVPVVEGDAVTREANDRAVAAAVDAFGGLDTLVNCVGVFDFYRGMGDIDADDASRRVRRDVPHQRAQPSAVGQSGGPRVAGRDRDPRSC